MPSPFGDARGKSAGIAVARSHAMNPGAIRRELLDQHAELRQRMQSARLAATSGSTAELQTALARVADYATMHNVHEEELLRDVFPTLEAWGMIRAEVMVDEHVSEHRELQEALGATVDRVTALAALDRLESHIEREEHVFLGEDVLPDEARTLLPAERL